MGYPSGMITNLRDLEPVEYHRRRAAARWQERERRRLHWLARTRRAVQRLAPAEPAVQRVVLFGSLVRPGDFRPHSDLDMALDCADLEAESRLWRALEEELRRDVDLRPIAGAVAFAVETEGEVVYERALADPRA